MYVSASLDKIKNVIKSNLGVTCSVIYKQGRKKILVESCTLDAAYPEIFVMKHYDDKVHRIKSLSFSYTDILTKTVCLSKIKDTEKECS